MIKIKNLELKSGVIQSPMAGCTDLAFRLIAREKGMEFAFLEMVSCESLVRKNAKTYDLMKTDGRDRPVGCQLVGVNPDHMGEAAAMVESTGEYSLIDINIGCPVPKITGPGGGSALLKEPKVAQKIFKNMMRNIKELPLTVKMRLGFADESGDEAILLAQIAEAEGLSAISVHGRTREQGYSGTANWRTIGRIKRAVNIPVFGNGDINSGEDAKRMLAQSGCDGVMLGRGALGNPWLYRSVEASLNNQPLPTEPTLQDRKDTFLKHFKLELELEGAHKGLLKSRKIAAWYFKGLTKASELRNKINHATNIQEVQDLIRNFNPDSDCVIKPIGHVIARSA